MLPAIVALNSRPTACEWGESMSGQQNTDRIQTTHIGSLPRPHDLLDIMNAKLNKQPYDEDKF